MKGTGFPLKDNWKDNLKDIKYKFAAKILAGYRTMRPFCGVALMGLTLLTGCTTGKQSGNAGTTEPSAGATGSKAAGNVLRYALISEPTTLDPAKVEDGTTIDLLQNVFEGLVKWDEKNNIVPALC